MKYYSMGLYSIFIINENKISLSKNDIRHDLLLSFKDDDKKASEIISLNELEVSNGFKCNFKENKIFYYKNELPLNLFKYFYENRKVNEDRIKLYLSIKDQNYDFALMFGAIDSAFSVSTKQALFVTEQPGKYELTPIFLYRKQSSSLVFYKMLKQCKSIEVLLKKYFGVLSKGLQSTILNKLFRNNELSLTLFRIAPIINSIKNLDNKRDFIESLSINEFDKMSADQIQRLVTILGNIDNIKHKEILQYINLMPKNIDSALLVTRYDTFFDFIFEYQLNLIEKTIPFKEIAFYKEHPVISILLENKLRINNFMEVEFPKSNIDLEKYSLKMTNCIRGYFNSIGPSCILFGVYLDGQLEYNVELNLQTKKIRQFERIRKTQPKPEIRQIIDNWLISINYFE